MRGSAAPVGQARERPRSLRIGESMYTTTVKPPMTDKLWGIHRILAERIYQLYLLWENASEDQRTKAEKKLIAALATRSKYSKAPRA